MKRIYTPFFFLFLSLICSNYIHATVFNAINDGDWDEISTWDQGSIPGSLDTVVIDGYSVWIDINTGNVTVKHLRLTNNSNINDSELFISELVKVTVTGDLEVTSENKNKDVEIRVMNGAILNVGGNVDFTRANSNDKDKKLLLTIMHTSRMNISGDFTFDYKNAKNNEHYNEIHLTDTAILDVTGNTTLYLRGGNDFDFVIQGSAHAIFRGDLTAEMSGGDDMVITNLGNLTIEGNLTLNSTLADEIVYLDATSTGSVTDVRGDIILSALSEGDVYINQESTSNIYIGGDFLRPTNYGALWMDVMSTLTYNGTQSQTIALANLTGSGADAFNFTNVVLNNSSGITLEDTMYVTENLNLTNGKITTTPTGILIIGDQATITGGSATAYIAGPMIKEGKSLGDKFVFPIGDESAYAPLEISKISNSSSQYMAQYFGDPPPFGTSIAPNVGSISSNQYWTLDKTQGSENVNVTLHWMDAGAIDINNLESLLVVGLNDTNIWESFGNGGTTGDIGSGVSGSVSSGQGDPPPFGVSKFTIGSSEVVTAVDLAYFEKSQVLSIYPNPVDNVLHLKGKDSVTDEGIMEVFGINGQRVYSGKCVLENGRYEISTNAINVHLPGTYLVRFTNEAGSYILKFNKF